MNKKKDPFDSYEWLDALHLYCRLKACYFFLLAQKQKTYDKNIAPSKEALQNLIKYHAVGYKVGIHPSWQSNDDEQVLKEEIEFLEYLTDRKIIHSRQHFIKFTLPNTYRNLIRFGIQKDHSMGYGTINGFRASVASSFYWYDLLNEESTSLLLYPFCFIDATSFYAQKQTSKEAFEQLMSYYHAIKKVNNLMITI